MVRQGEKLSSPHGILKRRRDILVAVLSLYGCTSHFVVVDAFARSKALINKNLNSFVSHFNRIPYGSTDDVCLNLWNAEPQQQQLLEVDEKEDLEVEIKIPTLFNPIGTPDAELSSNEYDAATQNVMQYAFAFLGLALAGTIFTHPEFITNAENLIRDPSSFLDETVSKIQGMGPSGLLYFGFVYTIAEILAIPAIPLTASAGYLFGVRDGTLIVLLSASIAASASFFIGKTLLRSYVEGILKEYPKLQKLDSAISKEGFKLMLLIRIAPIFPFALSNYLYGVTSVRFWPYFWGTLLGFAPGTFAYVYTGVIGKMLISGDPGSQPWYVYVGGLTLFTGFLKLGGDIASNIIEEMQGVEENVE